jgi:hypothetical protein
MSEDRTHWVECAAGAMFNKFNSHEGVIPEPSDSSALRKLMVAVKRHVEEMTCRKEKS